MYLYTQIFSLTHLIKPYKFDFMSTGKHPFTPNTLGWYLEDGKFVLFDVDAEGTVYKFGSFHTGANARRFSSKVRADIIETLLHEIKKSSE